MKKLVTVIMAFVMAATALSGCNDESDAGSLVRDKEADTTWKVKTTQSETSQPTVTEQPEQPEAPEQPEQPETPEEPSLPDFKDEEVVKQFAMQELEAIKNNDIDKYLELCNVNSELYSKFGEDDLDETYITEFFYEALSKFDWSEMDISEIELERCEYYELNNCNKILGYYNVSWSNGDYEADFLVFNYENNYSAFFGENIRFNVAGNANSIAKSVFTWLNQYCEKEETNNGYDTTKLTGSYYIGPEVQYDSEIMTDFVEEWLRRFCNIENMSGLLYIEMGANGFPTLVQWAESEDSTVIGQYPNADENGDVEFLW